MRMLLGCLLFYLGSWVNAANTMTINVDPSQTQFQVTLPANPTTGYQWTVKNYDQSLLKLTGSQYLAPQTKLVGAGGQMVFTFDLLKGTTVPASTTLLFSYARPWEAASGTAQEVIVNFRRL